jgi:prolyl oligopeptidase
MPSFKPVNEGSTVAPDGTSATPVSGAATPGPDSDELLWLEDVHGERAMAWVRAQNARSTAELQAEPGFDAVRQTVRAILDSKQQIPAISRRGNWFYNLWRDAANPRGLWRRTTLAEYRKSEPAWDLVLDLDALARAEGENWVWAGATWFGPDYRRVLLSLSRGGADAHVLREFDAVDKRFVAGGFELPEGKHSASWINADELYLGADLGPGSLTDSGYPRMVRRWRRGTAVSSAPVVFEAQSSDMSAGASVDRTPGYERTLFQREIDFYRSECFLWRDDALQRIDKPDDAQLTFWRQYVLISLRSDWTLGAQTWPRGALLAGPAESFLQGKPNLVAVFQPTAGRSLQGFDFTRNSLVLQVLDQVSPVLELCTPPQAGPGGESWLTRKLPTPGAGAVSITALHDTLLAQDSLPEALLVGYTDFLTPNSLLLADTSRAAMETLKARPSYFDATGMRVEQLWACSADGCKVPYFVVSPPTRLTAPATGESKLRPEPRPTLLYGYGGFEISLLPSYEGGLGTQWLARGGVYVLANIRGGGEFGPGWHQAALRQHKQRSYDDFAAVAEDLIARGITTPRQLGIQGGSNGGLMVAAVMLQRPELFKAVVCQVPLLDMKRYHTLLAGASWMAEYGNPDVAGDWEFIARYSPYQRLQAAPPAGPRLPRVLFVTSTRDDRVHPGHARKMAERMRQSGHDVLFWENIEGGHGRAADNAQMAEMSALQYTFLWRELAGGLPKPPIAP